MKINKLCWKLNLKWAFCFICFGTCVQFDAYSPCINMAKILALILLPMIVMGDQDLPKELSDQVLYCEGCYGTMMEIDEFMIRLKHETLNTRIELTLDGVCSTDLLRKYVFSPPKMAKVSAYRSCHQSRTLQVLLFSGLQGNGRSFSQRYGGSFARKVQRWTIRD